MLLVKTPEDVAQALEFIQTNEVLAYDTETTGLNPRRDKVIGFGVSNATDGFYVPIFGWDAKTKTLQPLLAPELYKCLIDALASRKLLMFNASFDARFTKYNFSVDLVPALHTDVLLLKHTCDEEFPFGLKEISAKLFGHEVKAEKEAMQASIKTNGGTVTEYYKADVGLLAEYCVQDCLLTFRIFNYYSKELKRQGLERFYYEDEVLPLYKEVTIPMEEHGIALDIPKMEQTLKDIKVDMDNILKSIQDRIAPYLDRVFKPWFLNKDYPLKTKTGKLPVWAKKGLNQEQAFAKDYPGQYMFNVQSKFHLKKLFFDTLECEPLSRTPTGLPQVDEEFMASVADDFPWAADLVTYNKLLKVKSTYIERFLEEHEEGIFYPSFYQHRTVSGRYGSDIQQLPRPIDGDDVVSRYTNRIREFFVARGGSKLLSADYEQLEPTVFAHCSGDPALIEIFTTGRDFYSEVAIRTERLRDVSSDKRSDRYLGKIDKQKRQTAKAYALGLAYGMTDYKLHFELAISQEEAKELVTGYFTAFPQLKRWINESHDTAKTRGSVKSEAGRVRHLPQAAKLFATYGSSIFDSLQLWKNYHSDTPTYQRVKEDYQTMKNLVNNSVNFQIQSYAASILNKAMININHKFKEQGLKAKLIASIHDEAVYEVPESEVNVVSAIVKYEMENSFKLKTPLRTQPQVGNNFRECK